MALTGSVELTIKGSELDQEGATLVRRGGEVLKADNESSPAPIERDTKSVLSSDTLTELFTGSVMSITGSVRSLTGTVKLVTGSVKLGYGTRKRVREGTGSPTDM